MATAPVGTPQPVATQQQTAFRSSASTTLVCIHGAFHSDKHKFLNATPSSAHGRIFIFRCSISCKFCRYLWLLSLGICSSTAQASKCYGPITAKDGCTCCTCTAYLLRRGQHMPAGNAASSAGCHHLESPRRSSSARRLAPAEPAVYLSSQ